MDGDVDVGGLGGRFADDNVNDTLIKIRISKPAPADVGFMICAVVLCFADTTQSQVNRLTTDSTRSA